MKNEEPDVSIIDYGINNLKSISKAFEKLNKKYSIITSIDEVMNARSLVLPGVGSFSDGMKGLHDLRLIEPVREKVRNGTPLLGICLGMQMLFSESEEFGITRGLDLIPGRVVPFKKPGEVNIRGYKIPHIGWNNIYTPSPVQNRSYLKNTILEKIDQNIDVFFIHSYYAKVDNPDHVLAVANYGGQEFCAVVQKDNIAGTQFHPEKSGKFGLKILEEYCRFYNI